MTFKIKQAEYGRIAGQWTVSLWDDDADMSVGTAYTFPTLAEAEAWAAGQVAKCQPDDDAKVVVIA